MHCILRWYPAEYVSFEKRIWLSNLVPTKALISYFDSSFYNVIVELHVKFFFKKSQSLWLGFSSITFTPYVLMYLELFSVDFFNDLILFAETS